MSCSEWNMRRFDAFEKSINIDLFNATVSLAAVTSKKEDAIQIYWNTIGKIIWGDRNIDQDAYFESQGLRYMGEVLERFESKFGSNRANFRAVALALGYASPFLSDRMFVGQQKEDFLLKLETKAAGDVYLLGAQYLLTVDAAEQMALLHSMSQAVYQNTEEAVFVLSLYENPAEGFNAMREQLVRLWGSERSLLLRDNMGLLEWLIVHCEEAIKECRKKDNTVLRALAKLPYMHAKEGTPTHAQLSESGYSKEEIILANSQLIWATGLRNRLPYNGIPAEKIAAECCITFLNSKEEQSEGIYEYLKWLMQKYSSFVIKYQGNTGIWQAIKDSLHPMLPQTVVWMIQNIAYESYEIGFPYRFDVFDPQWDVLAKKLGQETFGQLFTDQMLAQETQTRETVQKWLARYEDLTGDDYLNYFRGYQRNGEESFALMVEREIIPLWPYFKQHIFEKPDDNEKKNELWYIRRYAENAGSREAFDFLQQLMDEYDLSDYNTLFGAGIRFHSAFLKDIHNYGYRDKGYLDFFRPFLSAEEERQLFELIDMSVFQTEPSIYFKFVKAALANACVQEIYSKEELIRIMKQLMAEGKLAEYEARPIKEKLYTPEELAADQKALELQEEAEKQKNVLDAQEKKKKKLEEAYDGTFISLHEYLKSFFWEQDKKEALGLMFGRLVETAVSCELPASQNELSAFLHLCGDIVTLNPTDWGKLCPLLERMAKEGNKC